MVSINCIECIKVLFSWLVQHISHRSITHHRLSLLGIPSFISHFFSALGDVSFFIYFSSHTFLSCFFLNLFHREAGWPVTNSIHNTLLATLNARKMIRIAGEGTQTTGENLSVSLREFPKKWANDGELPFLFYLSCFIDFG